MPTEVDRSSSDLADILGPHVPALRRFARGLLRDADAADDLVQDCLVHAISRWHLRRSDGSLRAWLFTIQYNLFISERRALNRRGGPALQIDDWDKSVPRTDEKAGAEERLVWRDLMAGLGTLPEEQRTLVLLVGVEDLSYQEAAQVTGVPIGTIMSRLSRGRERLRRYIEGQAEPPIASKPAFRTVR